MFIGSLSTMHAIPSPSGTPVPIAAMWVISPGTNPRLQMLRRELLLVEAGTLNEHPDAHERRQDQICHDRAPLEFELVAKRYHFTQ